MIVLVRHGATEWSVNRRHTGRTDLPLLPEGEEEARALAPRLASRSFALVLSSPLTRAVRTAELAGLSPEPEPDLLEWDYGDYEGLTTAQIRAERPDWNLWRDGCPGGESPDDVARRADQVIARCHAAEGDACLVAHSHLLRMLTVRWLEQPLELGARIPLATASLSSLGFERDTRALVTWSC